MRQLFTGFLSLSFILGIASLLQGNAASQTTSEQASEHGSKKLTLRGRVLFAEIMDDSANSASALIIVGLKLEMVNTGTKPLIFLKTLSYIGGAALARTREELSIEDILSSHLTYDYPSPDFSQIDEWELPFRAYQLL